MKNRVDLVARSIVALCGAIFFGVVLIWFISVIDDPEVMQAVTRRAASMYYFAGLTAFVVLQPWRWYIAVSILMTYVIQATGGFDGDRAGLLTLLGSATVCATSAYLYWDTNPKRLAQRRKQPSSDATATD